MQKVDIVALGNPHMSLEECARFVSLITRDAGRGTGGGKRILDSMQVQHGSMHVPEGAGGASFEKDNGSVDGICGRAGRERGEGEGGGGGGRSGGLVVQYPGCAIWGVEKHPEVRVIATLGRDVAALARSLGYAAIMEQFGVELINDTCWCMLAGIKRDLI
jgi:hypothetical protein